MPSRNSLKQFQEESVYHVYNRGVAKADVFLDEQDYRAFLRRIELILLPSEEAEKLQHTKERIRIANYHGSVRLLAFCLMPNHFHFILWQQDKTAITHFMHTISTSYSMYFNRKYKRVGPLFQGRFKAAHVDNDTYLTHLSRYIHCNPLALKRDVFTFPYSSLQYYFSGYKPNWLEPSLVTEQFTDRKQYNSFVQDLSDLQAAESAFTLD